jgi:leucyl/phenylalanyl-tRNA--protein transferase
MEPILPLSNYNLIFPNPATANEEGILAYGGDLSVNRLLAAYTKGIFPWFNDDDPILWWSPDPRFVLFIEDLHISKSLKKIIKQEKFEIRYNTSFVEVLIQCANSSRPDQDGTWITPDMIEAYGDLHKEGWAHSFEAWLDDELVGGGYGVVIGNIFCGESMFTKKSNASKVAFVSFVNKLKESGFKLIDSQIHTNYLESFGAKHISREQYLKFVEESLSDSKELNLL